MKISHWMKSRSCWLNHCNAIWHRSSQLWCSLMLERWIFSIFKHSAPPSVFCFGCSSRTTVSVCPWDKIIFSLFRLPLRHNQKNKIILESRTHIRYLVRQSPWKVFRSIPVEEFFAKSNYFAPIRLIAAGDVFVRN